jgi:putative ABC transport system permease protein
MGFACAMTAVRYRLGVVLRHRVVSTVLSTVVVALVVGVVMALVAGAHRTATAPDRYTARYGGGVDVTVTQQGGRPLTDRVRKLPAVDSAASLTFVFGALVPKADGAQPLDASTLAGSILAGGAHLVRGRLPDPKVPGEFVASKTFMESTGSSVGEHFTLITLTQDQADTTGFATQEPGGPQVAATLVGQIASPDELSNPQPSALFSPSLIDDPNIGISATIMAVGLRPGATIAQLHDQLDPLSHDPGAWQLARAQLVGSDIRAAVNAQAQGLWAVAGLAALAGLVVLGQFLASRVAFGRDEQERLAALGETRGQMIGEMSLLSAVPIVVGTVGGTALSLLASNRFPTGFVRQVEPVPGIRFEGWLLVAGAALMAVALLAWVAVGGLVVTRRARPAPRRATLSDTLAARLPGSALPAGVRLAFGRTGRRGVVRQGVPALLLAVVCLVGALTFGASLNRLVAEPARWGVNYDFPIGGQGEQQLESSLTAGIQREHEVSAITYFAQTTANVGSKQLAVLGMHNARGHLVPPVLEGRAPDTPDEIALGRLEAEELKVDVGGHVTVQTSSGQRTFEVVGLEVMPSLAGNDGVGKDALVTLDALKTLDPTAMVTTGEAMVRADAPAGTAERIYKKITDWDPSKGPIPTLSSSMPGSILNAGRVRSTPYLLVGVLGALGVLIIAFVVPTSIRRERREWAVLRTMGADRRWITLAALWEAVSIAIVPVLIGVPVGLLGGARVFRLFSDAMGVVDSASAPLLLAAGVGVAVLLLVVLAALAAIHRPAVRPPSVLLRSE